MWRQTFTEDGPTFEIVCEGLVIGRSAFERAAPPARVLRGRFEPTAEYARVRPLFRADAVARARPADPDGEAVLAAFYAARDRLRFDVSGPDGRPLPVEYVHVYEPAAAAPDGAAACEVVARLAGRPSGHARPRRRGRRPRRTRPAT